MTDKRVLNMHANPETSADGTIIGTLVFQVSQGMGVERVGLDAVRISHLSNTSIHMTSPLRGLNQEATARPPPSGPDRGGLAENEGTQRFLRIR